MDPPDKKSVRKAKKSKIWVPQNLIQYVQKKMAMSPDRSIEIDTMLMTCIYQVGSE